MTVLLFGENGQIGSNVFKKLRQANLVVSGINRDDLDLSDRIGIKQIIDDTKPDIVINCSGYTDIDGAERNQNEANIVNGDAVAVMARACAKNDIPFMQLSTNYVFNGLKNTPYTPEDEPAPMNAYGLSKMIAEQAVETLCTKYIILRAGWVVSTHKNEYIAKTINQAKGQSALQAIDNQFGSLTSVDSLSTAIVHIAQAIQNPNFKAWGIYHFANTPDCNWYDLTKHIMSLTQLTATVMPKTLEDTNFIAQRPIYTVMDCQKTWDEFDLSPKDWHDEIQKIVAEIIL